MTQKQKVSPKSSLNRSVFYLVLFIDPSNSTEWVPTPTKNSKALGFTGFFILFQKT